jgi:hypothetical protein
MRPLTPVAKGQARQPTLWRDADGRHVGHRREAATAHLKGASTVDARKLRPRALEDVAPAIALWYDPRMGKWWDLSALWKHPSWDKEGLYRGAWGLTREEWVAFIITYLVIALVAVALL